MKNTNNVKMTAKQANAGKRQSGFTLLELMITVALAAILLTAAVPNFNSMVQNNRISTEANQFITAMNLARSEAIKRRANIDVVATDASDSNNEWGAGWSVVVNGGATLRTFPALQGGIALNSGTDVTTFQYQPSGRANATDALLLCDNRTGETGRQITVSATGRIAVVNFTCP